MSERSAGAIARRDLLLPGSVAAILAFAGLPLYIHMPRFYAEEMGVGLSLLGVVLLAARAVDSIQDPIIGRLADRFRGQREKWAVVSGILLAIGLSLLFAPPGWGEPMPRLIAGLLAAFTGFSALQIALYDHGLAQAEIAGQGYTRIALWREVCGIVGICLAAAAPAVLVWAFGSSLAYACYAVVFILLALIALGWMRGHWIASGKPFPDTGFADAIRVPGVAPVLFCGFVNALPTAVTSTLFLFFVADILLAKAHAGALLLVFFVSSAAAAPGWARLATIIGRKATLVCGMTLSMPAFVGAYLLGAGDVAAFYTVAAASGAALGADITLMPAMLAARIRGGGGQVFSLWTFLQKTALAVAAGAALPLLALAGYEPGSPSYEGQIALSQAYALMPCALKLVAITMLLLFVKEQRD